jgi:hypothetical protein
MVWIDDVVNFTPDECLQLEHLLISVVQKRKVQAPVLKVLVECFATFLADPGKQVVGAPEVILGSVETFERLIRRKLARRSHVARRKTMPLAYTGAIHRFGTSVSVVATLDRKGSAW